MQAKKEIVAGRLYIQTMYSAGMLPGMRQAERRRREKAQTEAKDTLIKQNAIFIWCSCLSAIFGQDGIFLWSLVSATNRHERTKITRCGVFIDA